MKKTNKTKKSLNFILYSIIAFILLSLIVGTMINYTYVTSESEAYEIMHLLVPHYSNTVILLRISTNFL